MRTLKRNQKFFGECPNKKEARQVTVINPYRKITGRKSVLQYWGLCGQLSDKSGKKLQENCEFNQLVREGLVKPHQFNGVEKDLEIHKIDKRVIRKLPEDERPVLHGGELSRVLEQALAAGTLRPSLVNVDMICCPENGADLVAKVLNIFNYVNGQSIVVWNTIMKNPTYRNIKDRSWDDVISAVESDPLFVHVWGNGDWKQYMGGFFSYSGTGRDSRTTMGTIIFHRNGKALRKAPKAA